MSFYERHTFGVIQTLEKRPGVCDIQKSQNVPASLLSITSWETKQSCALPEDLRSFYLTMNGLSLRWNVKINADMSVPVGHLEINPIEKLKRLTFGAVGAGKDHSLPTLADLHLDSDEESNEADSTSKPTFDHRTNIFELDPCDGYSKVCLVYRNAKLGTLCQSSDIWLLDRSLRWHFLATTFMNYYCQTMIHLGLPQWQLAFSDIGLLPQAKQWFNLYCPTLVMDQPFDEFLTQSTGANNQSPQLDVAKVFKGKTTDKKSTMKPIGSQIVKKKPPLASPLPLKPGSGKASTSSMQPNRTAIR